MKVEQKANEIIAQYWDEEKKRYAPKRHEIDDKKNEIEFSIQDELLSFLENCDEVMVGYYKEEGKFNTYGYNETFGAVAWNDLDGLHLITIRYEYY